MPAKKKPAKPAAKKAASKKASTRKGVIPESEGAAVSAEKEPNPGEKATTEELRRFRDEELKNTPRKHQHPRHDHRYPVHEGRSDDGTHESRRTPLSATELTLDPLQESRDIDWKETGLWLTGIVTLGVILKAVLGALWEKLVYSALKERIQGIESVASRIADKLASLDGKVDTLDDRFTMLEASQIEHGKAIGELSKLASIRTTLDRLEVTIGRIDTHVQDLQRWQSHVQGVWEGQRRRKTDPPSDT